MEGEFTLTSEPGKGSSFTFDLPMFRAEPEAELTPVTIVKKTDRSPDNVRILIVEDSAVNAEIFLSLLENMLVPVDLVENAEVAVFLIADNEYDLVLMDRQMLIMDACDATRKVRNELALKDVPITALAANTIIGERAECVAADMNDCLTKPIDPAELEESWIVGRSPSSSDIAIAGNFGQF